MFDYQVASCVLLTSDIPMASTYEKKCFLCNMKEIHGICFVDSQETSSILCKVLNVPYLINDVNKLENINYCHPCKKRILKIQESLEILKKLEKEVSKEKYFIRLQLETNHKVAGDELHYSPWNFSVELVNQMRFKSIKSNLKTIVKNQIDRKFCSMTKNYRIMKDITITERLKNVSLEKHNISKETTPLTCNIISTEKQALRNDYLSFPSNSNFADSPTNSPFSQVVLPLTSHVYYLDDIKLELLRGETINTTDIKDPLEGIVPDSGFVTENSITRKTFICGTCETCFDDYCQLDEHSCTYIESKSFRDCPNEFVSKVSLNTNPYIHAKHFLKCRYCEKLFPYLLNLKRHERTHSGEKPFKCRFCEKSFSEKFNMESHTRIHTNEKPFECKFCGKSFSRKSSMEIHKRIHTNERPFTCRYCDKTFRNFSNMKSHENIHKKEKLFKCKFCEKGFTHKTSIKRHERIHRNEKPFKCGYCDKTFRDLSAMKKHENIHKEVKPFKCKFCEKGFYLKASMETHGRIHTNEKPFKCGYCDKTFRELSNMRKHENIHKEEKPFKCKFCEKGFNQKGSMERHERIHTNEKPFTCGYCDKTFRDLSNMKRHENIHKEERHFKCKFCEKGFYQKANMETHERIHKNEKPFTCGYCDKTFRDFFNMKKHENIHEDEKPFKCKFCEKGFSQKTSMETHERIHTN